MLNHAKISCFADEIDTDLQKQISLLKELNIRYVEFRSAGGKGVADFTEEEAFRTANELKANGILVSAVGSPIGKIKITDDFEPHFKAFRHIAKLADILGTPYIRMFSFYIPKEKRPEDFRDEVLRRLSRLTDYAAKKNLILLHENEKEIYADTAPRCLDLMHEFYGPSFQATFDFANFVECGQDTQEAYDLLKPYIAYIHIKDADPVTGKIVPAGKGAGKIPAILGSLDTAGFNGYLSLEPHLVDFAALASLEQSVQKRGRMDGPEAFRSAYQALQNVLHS